MKSITPLVLATIASLAFAAPALASRGSSHGKERKSSPRIQVGLEIGPVGFGFSNVRRIPAPRPHYPRQRAYVPGHYETRCETVRVPGHYENVWVEPVYERHVDHCGTVTEVLVRAGYHKRVWVDGGYETREIRVWVPGHYR